MRRRWSRKKRRDCVDRIANEARDLRGNIESELGLDPATLGVRVWVLPPRYYYWRCRERENRVALSDLGSVSLAYPRMVDLGGVTGGEMGPGSPWSVGKGILGAVLADDHVFSDPADALVVLHEIHWKRGIENQPEMLFRREPPEVRLGRSRKDFRRLRAKYGAAVAVPIGLRQCRLAFGCATVHSPARRPLSEDEATVCASWLHGYAPTLEQAVVQSAYPIDPRYGSIT